LNINSKDTGIQKEENGWDGRSNSKYTNPK